MADKPKTFSKAIRAYCLDCCGGSAHEVKMCPATECELHPFRFGKNPYRPKRELTEEQKKEIAERFKKAREGGE
jgi:hypothetical protein